MDGWTNEWTKGRKERDTRGGGGKDRGRGKERQREKEIVQENFQEL